MLIQETGGIDGIRDDGLLDSALNSPFQSFDGEDIYKTIQAKAARLGLASNKLDDKDLLDWIIKNS